ncbi:MAG: hypothetical protein ACI4CY_05015 [Candidatus Gastranaerophilaceae bacterium]
MILKEFSDYIKSREALAEAFSESAEGATGTAGLADPTKAMKTTKSTDAITTEIATDSTKTTRKTDPSTATTTPTITDSAGAAGLADPTTDANATDPASAKNSANDIQNIKNPKTEERGKILLNNMEAFSTTDSEEVRGDSGKDPVSRGVRQPQNSKFSCVKLLNEWLVKKLRSVPISNVDKIICNELFLATNKKGATLIIAKRESGRKLLRALYNFSLSYEHYRFARRTHEVRPSNFTNRKD